MTAPTLPSEVFDALRSVSTATLCSQLMRRGVERVVMKGVRPLRAGDRVVGPAYTLRYLPSREDVSSGVNYDNNSNPQRLAIEAVEPSSVLVIDAREDSGAGTMGNILATRLDRRGVAGVVTDGAVRDRAGFEKIALPVFASGSNPQLSSAVHYPVDAQLPVACGGVLVMPGDVIVGDSDGVVVVPLALANEVATDAVKQERLEEYLIGLVGQGCPLHGVYPPDESTLQRYAEERA